MRPARPSLQPLSAIQQKPYPPDSSQAPVRHADFAEGQQGKKTAATVQFWLTFHAEFGQRLRVVGSHKNLGTLKCLWISASTSNDAHSSSSLPICLFRQGSMYGEFLHRHACVEPFKLDLAKQVFGSPKWHPFASGERIQDQTIVLIACQPQALAWRLTQLIYVIQAFTLGKTAEPCNFKCDCC